MEIFDRILIPTALVGCFIRFGNFINSEIIGTKTDLPWGIVFKGRIGHQVLDKQGVLVWSDLGPLPRHPAMLYESLSYLVIFIFLFFLFRKKGQILAVGRISGIFLFAVFTSRLLIEFVKIEQAPFMKGAPITMGQLLSLPLIAWAIYLLKRKAAPAQGITPGKEAA